MTSERTRERRQFSSAKWRYTAETLSTELLQATDEGRQITDDIKKEAEKLIALPPSLETERAAEDIFQKFREIPIAPDFPYIEPDVLEEIFAVRPKVAPFSIPVDRDGYLDKLLGAWLGRCAGCLLGQPVEGWHRGKIVSLLKDTGNYPLARYMRSDVGDEMRTKYDIHDDGYVYGSSTVNWINNVSFMPEDDDTNYAVAAVKILEDYGRDFSPADVAEMWINNFPFIRCCTAERIAYRNIVRGLLPPETAYTNNPFREWLGAQIRADVYGYVNPGNPEMAADMAWRDASISHVKNGIYGTMFIAAMLSAAACTPDIKSIIEAGLSQIPEDSRLYEEVKLVLNWYDEGKSQQETEDLIHNKYDEKQSHDWCHTNSNCMLIAMSLLYGGGDFGKSICLSVECGFDTDCNGATVGSIMGMILGAKKLDGHWTNPINNRLLSCIPGYADNEITKLAELTLKHVRW